MEAYGLKNSPLTPSTPSPSSPAEHLAAALDALSRWHSLNVAPSLLPSLEAAMAPVLAAQAALAAGGSNAAGGDALAAYGLPQGQRATTPAEPAPAPESQSELNRISRAGSAALAPVAFTLLGEGICLLTAGAGEPDAVVKQARNGWRAAVCNADSPMVAGKHYVEFKLLVRGYGELNIVSPQANHQLVTSWV